MIKHESDINEKEGTSNGRLNVELLREVELLAIYNKKFYNLGKINSNAMT